MICTTAEFAKEERERRDKMNSNDIMTLSIDSNAFECLKDDFDKVLKRTLGNMQVKDSDEATLTVKLSISLREEVVPDYDTDNPAITRTIINPSFTHKVSSIMQTKTEESGYLKGEYELAWDDETEDFILKPINRGQSSMFDDDSVYDASYEAHKDRMFMLDGETDE